ncbi:MAG: exo-alpha-sialidase [Euryarchaeota archaeon]|nr:exo-alpha-sialidase [Euryarchaeota archaeon]
MQSPRAPITLVVLILVVVSGCAEQTRKQQPEPDHRPVLSCPSPCAVVIDKGTRWEPAVAADPRDGKTIVAASMDQGFDAQGKPYSWPLAHVSKDGGATWATMRLPMGRDAPPTHPLVAYDHADDPAVLILADGTVLYTALVFNFESVDGRGIASTAASIALWRSSDGGQSFPEASILQQGSDAVSPAYGAGRIEFDKQWLASGADGTVLMAWNRNEQRTSACFEGCTQTYAASSTDGGRTWSPPSEIYRGVSSGAFPLVLDDGSCVVSYRETDDAKIHLAVSTDRGASWTTNTSIDSTTKFPVLAKTIGPGPTGERIYMAYPMTGETNGQPDVPQIVTLRWSDDGGRTWSVAIEIESTQAAARTSPALAATRDGSAIVTYWFPMGEGTTLSATLRAVAIAANGNMSERITLDAHEGTTRTTGDYMGLVALAEGQGAFAVWNARHGNGHVITGARLTTA